ncbi:hypothetical protein MIR68_005775 [Amoeboaphelidium protococcarum]|nr:hypothetical protein MIR68_005775 [Amoeboaphelidium protococcarum]
MSLIVLVHGLHGTHHDFDYMVEYLKEQTADREDVFILASECNGFLKTHLGLQAMGQALLQEVAQFVKQNMQSYKEIQLSVLGHSLGGLIARYVLPMLLRGGNTSDEDDDNQEGILSDVEFVPVGYYAVSSPHLGSRRGGGWMGTAAGLYLKYLVGRTGRELFMGDEYTESGSSYALLEYMSQADSQFMKALLKFPQRTLFGHLQDVTVPLSSSLIWPDHPLSSVQLQQQQQQQQSKQNESQQQQSEFQQSRQAQKSQYQCKIVWQQNLTDVLIEQTEVCDIAVDLVDLVDSTDITQKQSLNEQAKQAVQQEQNRQSEWRDGVELLYNHNVYCSLQNVDFRKVLFSYDIPESDFIARVCSHGVVVGKRIAVVEKLLSTLGYGDKAQLLVQCSQSSAKFIATMILKDLNVQ